MNMAMDLTKLQLTLDGETDIVVRRDFSHPPARVWRVLTEPALIQQWLAAQDSMMRCKMDLRPGGSYRYEWPEFYFSGPILEVDAPHHMVHIENFSADLTLSSTVTTDLIARGTGTRMTMVKRYADAATRAKAVEIGMTDGFDEVFDKFADLLIAA